MEKQEFYYPIFDPVANAWHLGKEKLPAGMYTNLEVMVIGTKQVFSYCSILLCADGHLEAILDTTFTTEDIVYDTNRISTKLESFDKNQTVVKLRKQTNVN
jgi:hypothetical protein